MEFNMIFVIGLSISITLGILLVVLYFRARHKKADISLLITTIILIAVGNVITLISENLINLLGNFLMGFGFITLFFHYEMIASDKPNRAILVILSMLYAMVIFLTVLLFMYLQTPVGSALPFFGTPMLAGQTNDFWVQILIFFRLYIISALAIIVFVRAIQIIYNVHNLVHLSVTRNELCGLSMLLIYRITLLPFIWLPEQAMTLVMTLSLIFSIIGLFVLIINYMRNPDYMYLLPFPIHSFMLYNKNGLLCYSRKVQQKRLGMDEKDLIISGAFTAISALINETLGSQAKIRHINAQQFQIYFNTLPNEVGSFVVIAYGATGLFEKSLNRFISMMTMSFFESLNSAGTEMEALEREIDDMIKDAFPYIQISNEKTN